MRATAVSRNKGRKTRQRIYNDLLSDPCDSCGSKDGTVSYQYVSRGGTVSWKTHCVAHMQPVEVRNRNRLNAYLNRGGS